MVGSFFAAVVCLGLLWFLVVTIRFSFIGGARAKGSEKPLQKPALSEIEAKWGVGLPPSLETYFRSEIVVRSDFYLAPPGSDQSTWWYIEGFLPLTRRDVSEWIKINNVPGIPIALDASKGTFYLPFESLRQHSRAPFLLRLAGRKRKDVEVAASVEEPLRFEPRNVPPEAG